MSLSKALAVLTALWIATAASPAAAEGWIPDVQGKGKAYLGFGVPASEPYFFWMECRNGGLLLSSDVSDPKRFGNVVFDVVADAVYMRFQGTLSYNELYGGLAEVLLDPLQSRQFLQMLSGGTNMLLSIDGAVSGPVQILTLRPHIPAFAAACL